MSSDDDSKEGLPMHEAARRMRVPFKGDVSPEDKTIKVNGLDLHYLD